MCCWRYHHSPQNLQVRLVSFHHSIKIVLLMAKSLDHWFSGIIRIGQHCSAVCMVPVVFTSSLEREKVVQIAKYRSMAKSPFWNAPWQNPPWDIAWTSYHQSCVVLSEISQNFTDMWVLFLQLSFSSSPKPMLPCGMIIYCACVGVAC